MRSIVITEPGQLELNFMWLPTFIGMNGKFKKEMEEELAPRIEGRELSEKVLDEVHDLILDYITEKFPIEGLRDYLDGMKFLKA